MMIFHGFAAWIFGFNSFTEILPMNILFTVSLIGPVVFGLSIIIQHRILSLLPVPLIVFFVYSILTIRIQAVDSMELTQLVEQLPNPIAYYSTKLSRELNRE